MNKQLLIIIFGLLLAACSGESSKSGDKQDKKILVGVFQDSKVVNLNYFSSSCRNACRTDSKGQFKYYEGETIQFSIGELKFPLVIAKEIITPVDFYNYPTDLSKIINLLRLLQSIDKDNNPENGIRITDTAHLMATSEINLDLGISQFEESTALKALIAGAGQDVAITELISEVAAVNHFSNAMKDAGASNAVLESLFTSITKVVISGVPLLVTNANQYYSFTPDSTNAQLFSVNNKPTWADFDLVTGRLSGTPNQQGLHENIIISASNDAEEKSLAPFNIQVMSIAVANTAPVISGTAAGSLNKDTAYSFQPNASDVDNDTLVFSINNKPDWANFSTESGLFEGVPTTEGEYKDIRIGVSDGKSAVYLPLFNIEVLPVNIKPVISGTAISSLDENTAYSFQPSATDAENDPLTFSISNKPAWASFNTVTGLLEGTPITEGHFNNIIIGVSDGKSDVYLPAFSILVLKVNVVPVISGLAITSLIEDTPYSFQPTATDADNDSLTFSISNKPAWANFSTLTGLLDGIPPTSGIFSNIILGVSDGESIVYLPAFNIEVDVVRFTVTISWVPPTEDVNGDLLEDISGYKILYGRVSGVYDKTVVVDDIALTRAVISKLEAGAYYFSMITVIDTYLESDPAEEVFFQVGQ